MKKIVSLIACFITCAVLLQYRIAYSGIAEGQPRLNITTWDASGYYMYLPAIFIYHDATKLTWLGNVDKKYSVTGGNGWQAEKQPNGNYVYKYLGGVAIMELPFFLIGHFIALHSSYPADGYSAPYEYAIAFGVLLYCMLAIFLLRKILLRYFTDHVVAIAIPMVCLATNFIEYVAIESGQSHAWIFPLYVLVLYAAMKWHDRPRVGWAALIGYIIGLAMISRPTEAIMLFIPLMWGTQNKEAAKEKWQLVKQHKRHIVSAATFGLIGILPQLIYWKIASGSFIYDVGSKWDFLNPHFRVLIGWEKGWFIYTPVTLFFIIGMFFIKKFPFRKSVLWFCLLNIYIIIAWSDWRYGGSYSTRALMQSYGIFVLPFAAFTARVETSKWRFVFYALCIYLLVVNLFQIKQYQATILHYNDMNRQYYGSIYLNAHPSPIDMSMLDTDERLKSEQGYHSTILAHSDTNTHIHFDAGASADIATAHLNNSGDTWMKIETTIQPMNGVWDRYLNGAVKTGDSVKHVRIRMYNGISSDTMANNYAFYMHIPAYFAHSHFSLYMDGGNGFDGVMQKLTITELNK